MVLARLKQGKGEHLLAGREQLTAVLLNEVDEVALNLCESGPQVALHDVLHAL